MDLDIGEIEEAVMLAVGAVINTVKHLDAKKEEIYKPVAKLYKYMFDQLMAEGFDEVQALHIVRNMNMMGK